MKDDMKELKDSMLKKLFSIGVLYHELTGKTLYLGGGIIRDVIYNSIYKSKDLYIYDLDIYGIDLDYKIINKIINNLDLSVLSDNNNTGYIYNTTRYISNKYEYIYNNINIIYNIINIISSNIPKDRLQKGCIVLIGDYLGYIGWKVNQFKAWQEYKIKYKYLAFGEKQAIIEVI